MLDDAFYLRWFMEEDFTEFESLGEMPFRLTA
jgi:hypothetical protein